MNIFDIITKKPVLATIGCSYSEGDSENVTKDLEKMKYFLQRTIESRKPPSLFDTPNTPPLFHQVIMRVSLTDTYTFTICL